MKRKTGVILSYIMMVLGILSTVLLTPFIIRDLGQAEYGVYKLSAAIVSYLFLLDLGVGNAVVRYVAKFKSEGELTQCRKFLGVSTLYYGVVAFLALIFGAILIFLYPIAFSKGLNSNEIILGQKLLAITVLTSAITLGTSGFSNTINAYERFSVSKGTEIIQVILRIILIFLALHLKMGSIGIVSVNLILTIIFKLFNVFYVIFVLKMRPLFKKIEKKFVFGIVAFSSFILLQMIATQINSFADEIMIGAFVVSSSVVVGIYGVGHQLAEYFQRIGHAVTGVLMPGVVRMVEKGSSHERLQEEMIKIGRIIFMIIAFAWVGFLVVGKDFVSIWAGSDYIDAYYVTLMLSFAYIFVLSENIGVQILWAMNQHKEQSIIKLCIVLLNVVLTYFLIKWNPLVGATIGTVVSLLIGDVVVTNILFVKKFGFNISNYYRSLFKGILPCLGVSYLSGYIFSYLPLSGWVKPVVVAIIMILFYIISMFVAGLNDNEKNMILAVFRKLFRKENR